MEERLRLAPGGLIALDHEGYIVDVNDTFLNELGYEKDSLVGNHLEYLCGTSGKIMFHSYFYPTINLYGHVKEFLVKFSHSDGHDVPFLLNGRRYQSEDLFRIDIVTLPMTRRLEYEQELRQAKDTLQQLLDEQEAVLTELQKINDEIQTKQLRLTEINNNLILASNLDTLTGISNRKHMQETLVRLVYNFWKTGEVFSLLILDIDYFKRVNDTYGHPVGDQVLVKLAAILKKQAQHEYTAARYGGEEFIILLPGASEDLAVQFAEQLRVAVQETNWDEVSGLTISIGLSTSGEGDDQLSILKEADDALYASKHNGRNQVTHFNTLAERT